MVKNTVPRAQFPLFLNNAYISPLCCTMKAVLPWTQLLPGCGQHWAQQCTGLSLGLFSKLVGNAMGTDRAVMQELCLAGTCAEWRSRKKAALSFPVCPCWFPTEHRVAAEGVTAQRPRGGSHGRRRPVPLGQPRAAPLCPQHPRALACCCKCAALTLLYSCPQWHPTESCKPDRH